MVRGDVRKLEGWFGKWLVVIGVLLAFNVFAMPQDQSDQGTKRSNQSQAETQQGNAATQKKQVGTENAQTVPIQEFQQNPSSFQGQTVRIPDATVQEISTHYMLLVPSGDNQNAAPVLVNISKQFEGLSYKKGAAVQVEASVEKAPDAKDVANEWELKKDQAAAIAKQGAYLDLIQVKPAPLEGAELLSGGNPQKFTNKEAKFSDLIIQEKAGLRSLWVGPDKDHTFLVVLGDPSAPISNRDFKIGQRINLHALVGHAPKPDFAQANWGLSADGAQKLNKQGFFLEALSVNGAENPETAQK